MEVLGQFVGQIALLNPVAQVVAVIIFGLAIVAIAAFIIFCFWSTL